MQKKTLLWKSTAIVLALCLASSYPGRAGPSILLPGSLTSSDSPVPSWADRIRIPDALGKVESRYQASPSGDVNPPSVIIIRDAHGHEEAQKNIRGLLHHLRTDYGIGLVFLEGGIGDLDGNLLRFFEDPELNRKAADFMLKEGIAGGPELFLLDLALKGANREGSGIRAFGAEDPMLYVENLRDFQEILSRKSEASAWLKGLKSTILARASRVFSPDLKEYFREWLFHEDSPAEIMRRLSGLGGYARRHLGIDFLDAREQIDWPQMVRFFKLKKLEKEIDAAILTEEEKSVFEWLGRHGLEAYSEGVREIIRSVTDDASSGQRGPRDFLHGFFSAASARGFSFERFPEFAKQCGLSVLKSELSSGDLFAEIALLNAKIIERLARTPAEKEVIRTFCGYLTLDKLFSLELVREDYREIKRDFESLRPSRLAERAGGCAPNEMDNLYEKAVRFYDGARERDEVMARNIRDAVSVQVNKHAVLIAGGFHAEGLTGAFRRYGISFVEISPQISEIPENETYQEVMARKAPHETLKSYLRAFTRVQPVAGATFPWLGEREAFYAAMGINAAVAKAASQQPGAFPDLNESPAFRGHGLSYRPVSMGDNTVDVMRLGEKIITAGGMAVGRTSKGPALFDLERAVGLEEVRISVSPEGRMIRAIPRAIDELRRFRGSLAGAELAWGLLVSPYFEAQGFGESAARVRALEEIENFVDGAPSPVIDRLVSILVSKNRPEIVSALYGIARAELRSEEAGQPASFKVIQGEVKNWDIVVRTAMEMVQNDEITVVAMLNTDYEDLDVHWASDLRNAESLGQSREEYLKYMLRTLYKHYIQGAEIVEPPEPGVPKSAARPKRTKKSSERAGYTFRLIKTVIAVRRDEPAQPTLLIVYAKPGKALETIQDEVRGEIDMSGGAPGRGERSELRAFDEEHLSAAAQKAIQGRRAGQVWRFDDAVSLLREAETAFRTILREAEARLSDDGVSGEARRAAEGARWLAEVNLARIANHLRIFEPEVSREGRDRKALMLALMLGSVELGAADSVFVRQAFKKLRIGEDQKTEIVSLARSIAEIVEKPDMTWTMDQMAVLERLGLLDDETFQIRIPEEMSRDAAGLRTEILNIEILSTETADTGPREARVTFPQTGSQETVFPVPPPTRVILDRTFTRLDHDDILKITRLLTAYYAAGHLKHVRQSSAGASVPPSALELAKITGLPDAEAVKKLVGEINAHYIISEPLALAPVLDQEDLSGDDYRLLEEQIMPAFELRIDPSYALLPERIPIEGEKTWADVIAFFREILRKENDPWRLFYPLIRGDDYFDETSYWDTLSEFITGLALDGKGRSYNSVTIRKMIIIYNQIVRKSFVWQTYEKLSLGEAVPEVLVKAVLNHGSEFTDFLYRLYGFYYTAGGFFHSDLFKAQVSAAFLVERQPAAGGQMPDEETEKAFQPFLKAMQELGSEESTSLAVRNFTDILLNDARAQFPSAQTLVIDFLDRSLSRLEDLKKEMRSEPGVRRRQAAVERVIRRRITDYLEAPLKETRDRVLSLRPEPYDPADFSQSFLTGYDPALIAISEMMLAGVLSPDEALIASFRSSQGSLPEGYDTPALIREIAAGLKRPESEIKALIRGFEVDSQPAGGTSRALSEYLRSLQWRHSLPPEPDQKKMKALVEAAREAKKIPAAQASLVIRLLDDPEDFYYQVYRRGEDQDAMVREILSAADLLAHPLQPPALKVAGFLHRQNVLYNGTVDVPPAAATTLENLAAWVGQGLSAEDFLRFLHQRGYRFDGANVRKVLVESESRRANAVRADRKAELTERMDSHIIDYFELRAGDAESWDQFLAGALALIAGSMTEARASIRNYFPQGIEIAVRERLEALGIGEDALIIRRAYVRLDAEGDAINHESLYETIHALGRNLAPKKIEQDLLGLNRILTNPMTYRAALPVPDFARMESVFANPSPGEKHFIKTYFDFFEKERNGGAKRQVPPDRAWMLNRKGKPKSYDREFDAIHESVNRQLRQFGFRPLFVAPEEIRGTVRKVFSVFQDWKRKATAEPFTFDLIYRELTNSGVIPAQIPRKIELARSFAEEPYRTHYGWIAKMNPDFGGILEDLLEEGAERYEFLHVVENDELSYKGDPLADAEEELRICLADAEGRALAVDDLKAFSPATYIDQLVETMESRKKLEAVMTEEGLSAPDLAVAWAYWRVLGGRSPARIEDMKNLLMAQGEEKDREAILSSLERLNEFLGKPAFVTDQTAYLADTGTPDPVRSILKAYLEQMPYPASGYEDFLAKVAARYVKAERMSVSSYDDLMLEIRLRLKWQLRPGNSVRLGLVRQDWEILRAYQKMVGHQTGEVSAVEMSEQLDESADLGDADELRKYAEELNRIFEKGGSDFRMGFSGEENLRSRAEHSPIISIEPDYYGTIFGDALEEIRKRGRLIPSGAQIQKALSHIRDSTPPGDPGRQEKENAYTTLVGRPNFTVHYQDGRAETVHGQGKAHYDRFYREWLRNSGSRSELRTLESYEMRLNEASGFIRTAVELRDLKRFAEALIAMQRAFEMLAAVESDAGRDNVDSKAGLAQRTAHAHQVRFQPIYAGLREKVKEMDAEKALTLGIAFEADWFHQPLDHPSVQQAMEILRVDREDRGRIYEEARLAAEMRDPLWFLVPAHREVYKKFKPLGFDISDETGRVNIDEALQAKADEFKRSLPGIREEDPSQAEVPLPEAETAPSGGETRMADPPAGEIFATLAAGLARWHERESRQSPHSTEDYLRAIHAYRELYLKGNHVTPEKFAEALGVELDDGAQHYDLLKNGLAAIGHGLLELVKDILARKIYQGYVGMVEERAADKARPVRLLYRPEDFVRMLDAFRLLSHRNELASKKFGAMMGLRNDSHRIITFRDALKAAGLAEHDITWDIKPGEGAFETLGSRVTEAGSLEVLPELSYLMSPVLPAGADPAEEPAAAAGKESSQDIGEPVFEVVGSEQRPGRFAVAPQATRAHQAEATLVDLTEGGPGPMARQMHENYIAGLDPGAAKKKTGIYTVENFQQLLDALRMAYYRSGPNLGARGGMYRQYAFARAYGLFAGNPGINPKMGWHFNKLMEESLAGVNQSIQDVLGPVVPLAQRMEAVYRSRGEGLLQKEIQKMIDAAVESLAGKQIPNEDWWPFFSEVLTAAGHTVEELTGPIRVAITTVPDEFMRKNEALGTAQEILAGDDRTVVPSESAGEATVASSVIPPAANVPADETPEFSNLGQPEVAGPVSVVPAMVSSPPIVSVEPAEGSGREVGVSLVGWRELQAANRDLGLETLDAKKLAEKYAEIQRINPEAGLSFAQVLKMVLQAAVLLSGFGLEANQMKELDKDWVLKQKWSDAGMTRERRQEAVETVLVLTDIRFGQYRNSNPGIDELKITDILRLRQVIKRSMPSVMEDSARANASINGTIALLRLIMEEPLVEAERRKFETPYQARVIRVIKWMMVGKQRPFSLNDLDFIRFMFRDTDGRRGRSELRDAEEGSRGVRNYVSAQFPREGVATIMEIARRAAWVFPDTMVRELGAAVMAVIPPAFAEAFPHLNRVEFDHTLKIMALLRDNKKFIAPFVHIRDAANDKALRQIFESSELIVGVNRIKANYVVLVTEDETKAATVREKWADYLQNVYSQDTGKRNAVYSRLKIVSRHSKLISNLIPRGSETVWIDWIPEEGIAAKVPERAQGREVHANRLAAGGLLRLDEATNGLGASLLQAVTLLLLGEEKSGLQKTPEGPYVQTARSVLKEFGTMLSALRSIASAA